MTNDTPDDARIRLEGAVERVEASLQRVVRLSAVLEQETWWLELAALQPDVDQVCNEVDQLALTVTRVGASGHFATLLHDLDLANTRLRRRVAELDEEAGGEWARGLQRLCERARREAPPPSSKELVLWSDVAPSHRLRGLVVAPFSAVLLFFMVSGPLRVLAGLAALALGAFVFIRSRPRRRGLLLPDRLLVEVPPPRAEFPLTKTIVTLDSEVLRFEHEGVAASLPATDDLLALIELARGGLLTTATTNAHELSLVLPRARTETGEYGAVLVTRAHVAFLPHETSADVLSVVTKRTPLRRLPADAVLKGLAWLPAWHLNECLAPLSERFGLRSWSAKDVQWRSDLRPQGRHDTSEQEAGTSSAWRDSQALDITLTFGEATKLERMTNRRMLASGKTFDQLRGA